MPNTLACREELFPTTVAELLLVNVWCWGLELLYKCYIAWLSRNPLFKILDPPLYT